MREMTKKFLLDAFAGESQAHMRYTIFAEKAAKKGLKNLANLFKAIAYAEFVHAKNHFEALKMVGEMPANVETCLAGETFEINEMYPVYNATAKLQKEKDAIKSTHYAMEAEKDHQKMYQSALKLTKAKKDYNASKIYVCDVCGHTLTGKVPAKCPTCAAPKNAFTEFSS